MSYSARIFRYFFLSQRPYFKAQTIDKFSHCEKIDRLLLILIKKDTLLRWIRHEKKHLVSKVTGSFGKLFNKSVVLRSRVSPQQILTTVMTNFVGKKSNYTYRNIVNPFNREESDCSDQSWFLCRNYVKVTLLIFSIPPSLVLAAHVEFAIRKRVLSFLY